MLIALLAGCLSATPSLADDVPLPGTVEFNRDVRPILSENCYQCHGPDKNQRKADLRLDEREGLLGVDGKGGAIVPGKPAESELLRRIASTDDDERMPPPKSGKQLAPREIEILRRWVEQGATWQGHWAYIVPTRPVPPAIDEPGFVRNPIDRFILDKQSFVVRSISSASEPQNAGAASAELKLRTTNVPALKHAPEADRVTLIRRLSFDLTGLPPSTEEVQTFIGDTRPDAYERLVDRLLASPHYGERMAMYWLDLVRFADTIGYHSDNPRDISPYRDYVIGSFNENLPFDRFTIEQLAGDLLPNASLWQRVASGYNRLLQTTEEGGAQPKEYTAKYAADRVRNVASVWLGATMGCSECHDHKFDPFTMRDFYSMAAFFADIKEAAVGRREPGMSVPSAEQAAEQERLEKLIAETRKKLDPNRPELVAAQRAWENELRSFPAIGWQTLTPVKATAAQRTVLKIGDDRSIAASGPNPAAETYTIEVSTRLKGIAAIRIEALSEKSLPKAGPGRSPNGTFVLSQIEVLASDALGELKPVAISSASASGGTQGVEKAIAAKPPDAKAGWTNGESAGRDAIAIFELEREIGDADETKLAIVLKHASGSPASLGRFRVSAAARPVVDDRAKPAQTAGGDSAKQNPKQPIQVTPREELPSKIAEILVIEEAKRKPEERQAIAAHFVATTPLLKPVQEELAKHEKSLADLIAAMPKSLVSTADNPRAVRMLPRGNWLDDSGEVVSPAVPQFLGKLETGDRRATRLDLARWLVAPENPLTARVFVNRLWKLFFGQGLSKSLEDLGSQGEWPTHPELLDWLAVEFRESGWDVKHIVRLMVLSGTYRQSSTPSREARAADPYNRLLFAQARFRLDAEMVRDNALATSGLLSRRVGGESVKPYQPEGYWDYLNFPRRTYEHDRGEKQYRRGLYTHWQRSFLHPSLLIFDATSREECTAERPRSNTPQQALVLLNDPTYVEAARVFATTIVQQGGSTPEDRVRFAYRRALTREPRSEELDVLVRLVSRQQAAYAKDPKSAEQLLKIGEAPLPQDADAVEVAAWMAAARTIFNLHEFVVRF